MLNRGLSGLFNDIDKRDKRQEITSFLSSQEIQIEVIIDHLKVSKKICNNLGL